MRQFVESLNRLYKNKIINESKVIELYIAKKITADEKKYILSD